MLPRRHRLTSSRSFTTAVRSGRRVTAGRVTGHVWVPPTPPRHGDPAQVGLIVSKRVGTAVQRHRVSRILRHAAAAHVAELPSGSVLILRALPGAADRDSGLAADVATIIERVSHR